MGAPRRTEPPPSDGARRGWRPARGDLALALVAVAAGAGLLAFGAAVPTAPAAPPVAASPAVAPPLATPPPRPVVAVAVAGPAAVAQPAPVVFLPAPVAAAVPAIPRLREPGGDTTPDLADYVNPGEVPTMAEVIDRLRRAGVQGGLAAFPPPGTRPPLVGLAVPEDYPLPPGYVRHHQTTDDGQDIEPILMYAPDLAWVDAAGRPVAIPSDRVVPPEHAPAGLPLRRIVVPAPLPAGPGR